MEVESGRINLPSANDSFDEEDTLSDDVEDEVFIKSARNGFRDKTLQKPLMAPRKNSERGNIKVLYDHSSIVTQFIILLFFIYAEVE